MLEIKPKSVKELEMIVNQVRQELMEMGQGDDRMALVEQRSVISTWLYTLEMQRGYLKEDKMLMEREYKRAEAQTMLDFMSEGISKAAAELKVKAVSIPEYTSWAQAERMYIMLTGYVSALKEKSDSIKQKISILSKEYELNKFVDGP